jgi:hypothetical protein
MRFLFKKSNFTNPFYRNWVLIFQVCATFAALDSLMVMYKPLQIGFASITPTYANALTWVAISTYIFIVDWSLSVFFPNALTAIIKNKADKVKSVAQWSIAFLSLLYCLVSVTITIGVSVYLRHSSSSLAIAKPRIIAIDSLSTTLHARNSEGIKNVSAIISKLENDKIAAVKRSQQNKELQKLKNEGHGWAIGELRRLEKNAASPFDSKIAAYSERKAAMIEQQLLGTNQLIASSDSINSFNMSSYKTQTDALSFFLLMLAVTATILQCFAGLMIALYRGIYKIGKYSPLTPVYTKDQTNHDTVYTEDSHNEAAYVTHNGKKYNSTQFTNWLRNSHNRSLTSTLVSLRESLYTHILLHGDKIDAALKKFIIDNGAIVGREVYNLAMSDKEATV